MTNELAPVSNNSTILQTNLPGPVTFFQALERFDLFQFFFHIKSDLSIVEFPDTIYFELQAYREPLYFLCESSIVVNQHNIATQPSLDSPDDKEEIKHKIFSYFLSYINDYVHIDNFNGIPAQLQLPEVNS
jgi:hypothetical protein